jgi:tRNA (cmo5U34)-methyltransferase
VISQGQGLALWQRRIGTGRCEHVGLRIPGLEVAGVFPDMIKRSVPGYSTLISTIGLLAGEYAQSGSNCYDLGCSVGAATLSMRHHIHQSDCRIIAVDNSEAMINRCRENLSIDEGTLPVELICADIRDIQVQNASVVLLNFTLQFIPSEHRAGIIANLYSGMRKGGILVLSEKIIFDDVAVNQWMTEMHHAFKRVNGYSDMEISQKRKALEKVLIPESQEDHLNRMELAGFQSVRCWFQCMNFISFIAIK